MAKSEPARSKPRIWFGRGGMYSITPVFFPSLYLLIDISPAIRYIQKFYQMRTQLQAISLRIQVRQRLESWRISALTLTYRPFEAMNR